MSETYFLKPREGYKIPDPDLRDFLPADGREVAKSLYWQKLLSDGDVVVAKSPDEIPPVSATPAKRKS